MVDTPFFHMEKHPPVAWVRLNRPDKKNAMTPRAWSELPGLFAGLDADADLRAIVIAGTGDGFCAGIDLTAMIEAVPELAEPDQSGAVKWRLLERIAALQDAVTAVERCRKPVIASVHGFCIGAGLDLAAACDIRLCSSEAVFRLKEAAMGMVADLGALQRLPGIVGQGIAREMAFTAAPVSAERAKAVGLVSEVFADRAALEAGAARMAEAIAANAPLAVQASKAVLNHAEEGSVGEGLRFVAAVSAGLLPSADLREALAAFREKRPPTFRGR